MKKDYFQSLPKPKEIQKSAYASYLPKIQHIFQLIQKEHSQTNC